MPEDGVMSDAWEDQVSKVDVAGRAALAGIDSESVSQVMILQDF